MISHQTYTVSSHVWLGHDPSELWPVWIYCVWGHIYLCTSPLSEARQMSASMWNLLFNHKIANRTIFTRFLSKMFASSTHSELSGCAYLWVSAQTHCVAELQSSVTSQLRKSWWKWGKPPSVACSKCNTPRLNSFHSPISLRVITLLSCVPKPIQS